MNGGRDRLPGVYAIFLTLRDQGLDDMDIADQLGLPVESLPLLARLAEAKSVRLAGEKKCEDVASSKDDA
jgi:hypothetical protein